MQASTLMFVNGTYSLIGKMTEMLQGISGNLFLATEYAISWEMLLKNSQSFSHKEWK